MSKHRIFTIILALVTLLTAHAQSDYIDSLRTQAESGDPVAQNSLGVCYCNGEEVEQNSDLESEWFRKAAEQGFAPTQYNPDTCSDIIKQKTSLSDDILKAAEQGDALMQYYLGLCYYYGDGVEQNYDLAAKWYQKAAEQGLVEAEYNCGVCYYYGEGFDQNFALAAEWYRKAAEKDFDLAQFHLGNCYYYGEGVDQNYDVAAEWYRKAAEQGYDLAQFNLGVCYAIGEGVTKNIPVAMYWLNESAENGCDKAQEAYDYLYNQGYRAASSPDAENQ